MDQSILVKDHARGKYRDWLLRRLPKVCSADPETLTKYIMAMVSKGKDKKSLSNDLRDFIEEGASEFVEEMSREAIRLEKASDRSSDRDKKDFDRDRGSKRRYGEERERERDRRRREDWSDKRMRDFEMSSNYMEHPLPRTPISSPHSAAPPMMGFIPAQGGYPHGIGNGPFGPVQMPPLPQGAPVFSNPYPQHQKRGGFHGRGGRNGEPVRSSDQFTQDDRHFGSPRNGNNPRLRTLCVMNIPRETNTIVPLTQHFAKFGSIKNIQISSDKNLAFVEFENHKSAKKAFDSPDPVLSNRFISIKWAKYNPQDKSVGLVIDESMSTVNPDQVENAKKVLDERKVQLKEQIEKNTALLEKLKSMSGFSTQREEQIKKLEDMIEKFDRALQDESITSVETSSGVIQEKLALAEKEAKMLGLLSEAGAIHPVDTLKVGHDYSRTRGRGRGSRGNGRGIGRGGFPSFRSVRPEATRIDNRSKTLYIRGIPPQWNNEKMVRSAYQTYGEILRTVIAPDSDESAALVEFANVQAAEQAFQKGQKFINTVVRVEWYQGEDSKFEENEEVSQEQDVHSEEVTSVQHVVDLDESHPDEFYGSDEEEYRWRSRE